MTQRVLRWEVPANGRWHEIGAGRVVQVAVRNTRTDAERHLVEVWTLENTNGLSMDGVVGRSAIVVGTGDPAPANTEHLGTAVVPSFATDSPGAFPGAYVSVASRADLVWHVFGAYGVMP